MAREIRSGKKAVAVAGTAEPLVGSTTLVRWVRIKALLGNNGNVFVGNDGADDVTSANGFELDAGQEVEFGSRADFPEHSQDKFIDLNKIILDVGTGTEGVSYVYETQG